MGIKESLNLSKSVWSMTFRMIARYPRVLIPFFSIAVFEALLLTVLFYYPRPPVSAVFAQPIQAFFGARYLHYPYNFLLLPKLFYYGQILTILTLGVVMFGMAVGMVGQVNMEGNRPRISGNINRALRRYFSLAGVWLITFIASWILLKASLFLITKFSSPPLAAKLLFSASFYGSLAAVFLVESIFVYAYPAIIIERKGFIKGVVKSFSMIKGVFITTVILVLAPRILDIVGIVIRNKVIVASNVNFPAFPEISAVVIAAIILMTFISDSLVFLSTANLFMLKMEVDKKKEDE